MMKCVICGRTSQPGAKLCADCSSARKRAFAATVTQPLLDAAGAGRSSGRLLKPSQSVAATARRAAERAHSAKPPAAELAVTATRRWDVIFLVAGLIVVLLIGAYVARQIQKSREVEAPQVVEQPAPATPGLVSGTVSVVPAGLSPKNVAETAAPDTAGAIAPGSPPGSGIKPDPAKRTNARLRGAPVEAAAPPPEPPPAPAPIAAAPVLTPVPEAREAPPDPWQLMNDALARCAAGGLFDRILCDQRVRREYCDGRWGQVPQCPSGVANDRGQ